MIGGPIFHDCNSLADANCTEGTANTLIFIWNAIATAFFPQLSHHLYIVAITLGRKKVNKRLPGILHCCHAILLLLALDIGRDSLGNPDEEFLTMSCCKYWAFTCRLQAGLEGRPVPDCWRPHLPSPKSNYWNILTFTIWALGSKGNCYLFSFCHAHGYLACVDSLQDSKEKPFLHLYKFCFSLHLVDADC